MTSTPVHVVAPGVRVKDGVGKLFTVYILGEVMVPVGKAIVILPVVAPEGRIAVITDELFTVNAAFTPLNFTDDAELRFDPLM